MLSHGKHSYHDYQESGTTRYTDRHTDRRQTKRIYHVDEVRIGKTPGVNLLVWTEPWRGPDGRFIPRANAAWRHRVASSQPVYVRIQELATGENDDRKDKRLSNLIRDIEFTDTAGNETRGMYR